MNKWTTVRDYIEKNFTIDADDISKIISELRKGYTPDGADVSFITVDMIAKVASKYKKRIETKIPEEEAKIIIPKANTEAAKVKTGFLSKLKKLFGG